METKNFLALSPKEKTLVIWNKIDLAKPEAKMESIQVSAKKKIGLDELKMAIDRMIWKKGMPSKEEVMITKLRHFQALSNAIHACRTVIEGLKSGISAEFTCSDMRFTLSELGKIIGTNVTEDILSAIFSKFCLGK